MPRTPRSAPSSSAPPAPHLARGRWALAVALALAMGAAASAPAQAGVLGIPEPEVALSLGRAFAVGSPTSGAFDQGGFTAMASALWPWESRFRFGLGVFAADLGNQTGEVVLTDPAGGPSLDYGRIELGHRGAWGAAWRFDALGPAAGPFGRAFGTVGYGYYRFQNDRSGHIAAANSAVGGSLGLGIERAFTPHQSLRLIVGATFVSDTFTKRFGTADLEWAWRR